MANGSLNTLAKQDDIIITGYANKAEVNMSTFSSQEWYNFNEGKLNSEYAHTTYRDIGVPCNIYGYYVYNNLGKQYTWDFVIHTQAIILYTDGEVEVEEGDSFLVRAKWMYNSNVVTATPTATISSVPILDSRIKDDVHLNLPDMMDVSVEYHDYDWYFVDKDNSSHKYFTPVFRITATLKNIKKKSIERAVFIAKPIGLNTNTMSYGDLSGTDIPDPDEPL